MAPPNAIMLGLNTRTVHREKWTGPTNRNAWLGMAARHRHTRQVARIWRGTKIEHCLTFRYCSIVGTIKQEGAGSAATLAGEGMPC